MMVFGLLIYSTTSLITYRESPAVAIKNAPKSINKAYPSKNPNTKEV